MNQSGVVSIIKNAWHHPDFLRERAVECLLRAQQSGDSDCSSWMLGSVSHVRNGEGNGNGGTAAPGRGGGRKRRSSAFSVESNSTIDTSDRRCSSYMELENEFNYALPSLPISYSSALPDNNRKKRMSWTAGAGAAYPTNPLQAHQSWSFGDASSNNAVPSLSSTQSSLLTTGSNRASMPTYRLNQSWTVGSGATPFNPASIQLNQSWTMGVNNLSQIQLSQVLMSPQYDFSASYQPQSSQQQGQGNPSANNPSQAGSTGYAPQPSQVGSTGYAPQQSSNANSHVNPYEATLSAQEQVRGQQQQQQQQQWGVQNQWQQPQQQPQQQYQGNEGREAQGGSGSGGGTGGGMTEEDLDLKVFFEKFAAQMEEEEDGEDI